MNEYILKHYASNKNYIIVEQTDNETKIITDFTNISGKLFAINKKDEAILNAYLANKKVKIEWYTNYGDNPYIWDDYYLDFLNNYDEQEKYRLKG